MRKWRGASQVWERLRRWELSKVAPIFRVIEDASLSISLVPHRGEGTHTPVGRTALVFSCGELAAEAARRLAFGEELAAIPAVLRDWEREEAGSDAFPVPRKGSSVSGFIIPLDGKRMRAAERNGTFDGYERAVAAIELAGQRTMVYVYTKSRAA